MIDLCLVNPNNRVPAPFSAIEPPLWLGLIAGYHLSLGESVAIVDAEAEGLTIEQTTERVVGLDPRETIIVVMGANPSVSSTPKMPVSEELLKHFKAKLTGLHPVAMNYPNAVAKPFEGFPRVPWHLLPLDKYKAHNWHCLGDLEKRNSYAVLYTSLNCPFKCNYCNISALYRERKITFRPLEDIYKEMNKLAWMKVRNIKIWDELFALKEKRVSEICDGFREHQFNIWAYARLDTITEKMLKAMSGAGVSWLAYGFESVNDKKSKLAKRAIEMTRDAGINIMGNFLFGLPGETEDSMKASLALAIRENFEYVNFNVALPYPGSEWYDSLKVKPTDWSSFSQFSPKNCADPAVRRFRDNAFQAYFNRPEYLSMIERKFGEVARAHIKRMVAWQIR